MNTPSIAKRVAQRQGDTSVPGSVSLWEAQEARRGTSYLIIASSQEEAEELCKGLDKENDWGWDVRPLKPVVGMGSRVFCLEDNY